MKPHHLPPASIYYFKARLRPLASPVFWVSVMVLSSMTFFLWEMWTNPERLSTFIQPASDSETLNFDASTASDPNAIPTGEAPEGEVVELSPEERAIAEIEQLERLARKSAISIDATPNQSDLPATTRDNSLPKPQAPKIGEIPEISASTLSSQTSSSGIYIPKNPFSNPGTENPLFPSADTSFYNPEISISSLDPSASANLSVHPLQSAIERHRNDEIPFTPALPQSRALPEELRPNAEGILSSSELRPNAIIASPELRPSASNLAGVLPRQTGEPTNTSPRNSGFTPPPTNSYDYLVQSAPGSGVPAPAIPSSSSIAPVYDLRQLPPQMRGTNPENPNDFNYQGLQPSQITPSPFSQNTPAQENLFEGYSRINTFANP